VSDKECYKKLYGDLIYHVRHYYPKCRQLTDHEIAFCSARQNTYSTQASIRMRNIIENDFGSLL
jgi:hypothetical protein